MIRIRILFHKTSAMRYTGHLDLHHAWERIFRRARLPLAYSQGFHPQPRLNLACALPLGFTSQAETLDAWLDTDSLADDLPNALAGAAPPGIEIISIDQVDLRLPALQTQVISAGYEISFLDPTPDLEIRLARLLESESIVRQRGEKTYDLRPLIESIEFQPPEAGCSRLLVRLAAREGATGRPEELVAALGFAPTAARFHRRQLYFKEQPQP